MEKNKIKPGVIAEHHMDDITAPGINMFGREWDKFTNVDVMLLEPDIGLGVLDLPKKTMEARRNE